MLENMSIMKYVDNGKFDQNLLIVFRVYDFSYTTGYEVEK